MELVKIIMHAESWEMTHTSEWLLQKAKWGVPIDVVVEVFGEEEGEVFAKSADGRTKIDIEIIFVVRFVGRTSIIMV